MGREIVHVHIGSCGNAIGNAYWQNLMDEHRVNEEHQGNQDHLEYVNVCFGEGSGRAVPRAVFVDLEPSSIDSIRASPTGAAFHPDCLLAANRSGTGNNFAKGHYTEGCEILPQLEDVVRKQVEACDLLAGFQLMHSTGGGTGSGLGSLFLLRFRDAFPDRMISTWSVLPSQVASDVVVESYNTLLTLHNLIENTDMAFTMDNEALFNIAGRQARTSPSAEGGIGFAAINGLVARAACGLSAPMRFPGALSSSMRKMCVNLCSYARLRFMEINHAPLLGCNALSRTALSEQEIIDQVFSRETMFTARADSRDAYLSASLAFRGCSIGAVEQGLYDVQQRQGARFGGYLAGQGINLLHCALSPGQKSCTMASVNAHFKDVLQTWSSRFGALYKRKAFLHSYLDEGMDGMEFEEADKNVRDVIVEYGSMLPENSLCGPGPLMNCESESDEDEDI